MSYDSRINRLQQVIAELTHAPKVEAVGLSPADSSNWDNSLSQGAYRQLTRELDDYFSLCEDYVGYCVQALRRRLTQVEQQKQDEYTRHQAILSAKTNEKERSDYLANTPMDPSVKAMLSGALW